MIVADVAATIQQLKGVLPDGSRLMNDVLSLEGQLNDAKKEKLRGISNAEDLQVTNNRIRANLLDLISALQIKDFESATADDDISSAKNLTSPEKQRSKRSSALLLSILGAIFLLSIIGIALYTQKEGSPEKTDLKTGTVVHNIPGQMQVGKVTRCVVRLAYEEAVAKRDFDVSPNIHTRSILMSEVMAVGVIAPQSESNFKVIEVNNPEQFIEEGEHTEWIFLITPLQEGRFPLILKITKVEIINGQEKVKEMVLEEMIQVFSIGDSPNIKDESEYKPSNIKVVAEYNQNIEGGLIERTLDATRFEDYHKNEFTFTNMTFSVPFPSNSVEMELGESSLIYFDSLVAFASGKNDIKIKLTGHTDNIGSDSFNLTLGIKRAQSVKNFLIKKGVVPEQIVIDSKGESNPVAPNETENGRRKNRRVTIFIET